MNPERPKIKELLRSDEALAAIWAIIFMEIKHWHTTIIVFVSTFVFQQSPPSLGHDLRHGALICNSMSELKLFTPKRSP